MQWEGKHVKQKEVSDCGVAVSGKWEADLGSQVSPCDNVAS